MSQTDALTARSTLAQTMFNKVPEVTVFFWVIKILATTVGESAADYLSTGTHFGVQLGFGWTSALMTALLAVVLIAQFRLRRYVPGVY
ncbi:MAG: hypothetical protein QOH99_439, partial [Frankiaceae bacterium]|nr:hypothetical protein [Frankiaceae bacterium]